MRRRLLKTLAAVVPMMALMALASSGARAADGTGVATVSARNGSCLHLTEGNNVDQWDVAEGGSYTITITGVTECDPAPSAIKIFIQNSHGDNFCLVATGGDGTYSANFEMPNPACFTMPISYKCDANGPCDNSNTFNAKGPSGAKAVHLRAAYFDANCNYTGNDEDCTSCVPGGKPVFDNCQDSTIPLGCNPEEVPGPGNKTAHDPVCNKPVNVTVDVSDTDEGTCGHKRTITYTATLGAESTTCTVIYTWTTDTDDPTITAPNGRDFGCNPTDAIPENIDALVSANDTCDTDVAVNITVENTSTGCHFTRTFHITATDDCGNDATQDVVYTWKVDHDAPTFTKPDGYGLGCNPDEDEKPTNDSIKELVAGTAQDGCDGDLTINVTHEDTTDGCMVSRTFTITVSDECGNTSDPQQVVVTWKVDTTEPTLTGVPTQTIVKNPACGASGADVSFSLGATDLCDGAREVTVTAVDADGNPVTVTSTGGNFPCGTSTVTVSAVDICGNRAETSFQVKVNCRPCTAITIVKADSKGLPLGGFKFSVHWVDDRDGSVHDDVVTTDPGGTIAINIPEGASFKICEVLPGTGTSCFWIQTFPLNQDGSAGCYEGTAAGPEMSFTFNNVCVCPPPFTGTIGFWANKNGQALETAADFVKLTALYLRDGAGANKDFTSTLTNNKTALATWLTNANATNMAYMLSAQLAGTVLNTNHGLDGTLTIVIPANAQTLAGANIVANLTGKPGFSVNGAGQGLITINDLITLANASLQVNNITKTAGAIRTYQDCLKTLLDAINNASPGHTNPYSFTLIFLSGLGGGVQCPIVYP